MLLYSPFFLQNNTFGKRLRCLTKVCYLKLKNSDIWTNSDNLSPLEPLGGCRKMLQSAKSNEYISSVGSSWDMFNLEGPHLPYFMAISLLFYGIFWLKMAILGHRQSQRPQMGWTLVDHGWTLYFTSGGVSLDPFCPQKMAFGGPRTPQKWPFLAQSGHIWP